MGPPSGSKSSLGLDLRLSNLEGKLTNVEGKIDSVVTEVRGIADSLKFFSDTFDRINAELRGVITEQGDLRKENQQLRTQLADVFRELENVKALVTADRSEKLECGLELYPVALREGEDLRSIVAKVAEISGCPLTADQVKNVYRRKVFKADAPGPVVVKLSSPEIRSLLLRKVKERQPKVVDLGFGGGEERFYANEELTVLGRRLLFKAQQFRRAHKYRFVWVKDGKVLLRKGLNDKCVVVTSEADLEKLV